MQAGSPQRGYSAEAPAVPGWRTCDQSHNETRGLSPGAPSLAFPAGSRLAISQTVLDFQKGRLARQSLPDRRSNRFPGHRDPDGLAPAAAS
jgi:hypothetical protein